jgi:hypothetical protein
VLARDAKRKHHARRVDRDHDEDDRDRPPRDVDLMRVAEASYRRVRDDETQQREDRGLRQRG